jgi:hypothetical protein
MTDQKRHWVKKSTTRIAALALATSLFAPVVHSVPNLEERGPWVEYFLDQISGIRVEISRLESQGVVEELRRNQARDGEIQKLQQQLDELRDLVLEQQQYIEQLKAQQK